MSNLQAAVGVAQLEQLDHFISIKRKMGAMYTEGLFDLTNVRLPVDNLPFATNHYWVYPLVLKNSDGRTAREVTDILNSKGVGTRPFFFPLHKQPVLSKYYPRDGENLPNSEFAAEYGFYLPSGLALTEEQIECVIERTRAVLQNK